jgi:hypothetical protein
MVNTTSWALQAGHYKLGTTSFKVHDVLQHFGVYRDSAALISDRPYLMRRLRSTYCNVDAKARQLCISC